MNCRDNPAALGNRWEPEPGEKSTRKRRGGQPPRKCSSFSRRWDGLANSDLCLPNYEASAKNAEMLFGKQLGVRKRHKKAKQVKKKKAKPKQFGYRDT